MQLVINTLRMFITKLYKYFQHIIDESKKVEDMEKNFY
jgi:hypothetical protein